MRSYSAKRRRDESLPLGVDVALSWPAAIAVATRFRSWALTGQTTSHARQYASMMWADCSSLSSARRVYASCSCCWPQAGHVEKKAKGLVMGADPFPTLRSEALTRTS